MRLEYLNKYALLTLNQLLIYDSIYIAIGLQLHPEWSTIKVKINIELYSQLFARAIDIDCSIILDCLINNGYTVNLKINLLELGKDNLLKWNIQRGNIPDLSEYFKRTMPLKRWQKLYQMHAFHIDIDHYKIIAKYDQVDVFNWLSTLRLTKYPVDADGIDTEFKLKLLNCNSIKIIKWICHRHPFVYQFRSLLSIIISSLSQIEMLRYLTEIDTQRTTYNISPIVEMNTHEDIAVCLSNQYWVDQVNWALDRQIKFEIDIINQAAQWGDIKLLDRLINLGYASNTNLLDNVIQTNNLDVIEWVYVHYSVKYIHIEINSTMSIDVIKWLHQHGAVFRLNDQSFTNIEHLQYLESIGLTFDYTEYHFELIKDIPLNLFDWYCDHKLSVAQLLKCAFECTNLNAIDWLIDSKRYPMTIDWFRDADKLGKTGIVNYLALKSPQLYTQYMDEKRGCIIN